MQIFIKTVVVLTIALSSNALFMLGINYLGAGGSPLEKIHPALYLALFALSLVPLYRPKASKNFRTSGTLVAAGAMLAAAIWLTVWAAISPFAGGELTVPFVTFVLPAALLILFTRASNATLEFIGAAVPLFLLANSLFGIVGSVTGVNILPQTSGNVVIYDPRPTALLGHPLINSQITGVYLLYLVLTGVKRGFTPASIMLVGLHLAALLAFGGRSALAFAVLLAALYFIYKLYQSAITGNVRSLLSLGLLLALGAVAVPFALQAGVADVLFDRIADDRGSADTRLAAIQMLSILNFDQWIMGVGPAQRFSMLTALNTPNGVESFPLALLINFGLPAMVLITGTTFYALYRLAKPMGGVGHWLVVYFFLTSAASLSIGSKTTSLALFVIVLVALHVREASAKETPKAYRAPAGSVPAGGAR
mgnify:CR=1 FL=1